MGSIQKPLILDMVDCWISFGPIGLIGSSFFNDKSLTANANLVVP